jgi:hypothetical protein
MKAYLYDNLMSILEKKKLRHERKILLENILGRII